MKVIYEFTENPYGETNIAIHHIKDVDVKYRLNCFNERELEEILVNMLQWHADQIARVKEILNKRFNTKVDLII